MPCLPLHFWEAEGKGEEGEEMFEFRRYQQNSENVVPGAAGGTGFKSQLCDPSHVTLLTEAPHPSPSEMQGFEGSEESWSLITKCKGLL